jgi:hypothetical protein
MLLYSVVPLLLKMFINGGFLSEINAKWQRMNFETLCTPNEIQFSKDFFFSEYLPLIPRGYPPLEINFQNNSAEI